MNVQPSTFDKVLESSKTRKRKLEIDADVAESIVTKLLEKMDEAYAEDIRLYEQKQPAMAKLKLLNQVVSDCNK
jgi:hypothetical protein